MKLQQMIKQVPKRTLTLIVAVLLLGVPASAYAGPVGTAFTYQGSLTDGGSPADGTYDFEFKLFDAASGGSQVGSTIIEEDVNVAGGFFSVMLDFGNQFSGQARYLEIGVRPGAETGSFTTFTERQELTPTPYALGLQPGAIVEGNTAIALSGISTSNSPNPAGLYGEASGSSGRGVFGKATATSGPNSGVRGETASASSNATGVFGLASSGSATGAGVKGQNNGSSGYGVWGQGGANAVGVLGQSGSGYGVQGVSTSNAGVHGQTSATNNHGVVGVSAGTTVDYAGVKGIGPSAGVIGEATDVGYGVQGSGSIGVVGTTDDSYGVYGQTDAPSNGVGVYGVATGTSGTPKGVYGEGYHTTVVNYGVHGLTKSSENGSSGVYGQANASSGSVYGVHGFSESSSGVGVYGAADAGSSLNRGVYGFSPSTAGRGVEGHAASSSGINYGVFGRSDSSSGYGGFFINTGFNSILLAANNANSTSELEFKVDSSGNVYADGGYHCGQNVNDGADNAFSEIELDPCLQDNAQADFAEMLPTSQTEALEPGDVLTIDVDGNLTRSSEAYQPTVVGIYSTRPSYLGNSQFAGEDGYAPLALVGVVPVKASGENGSIQPGDMLTAASIPGHAMRAGPEAPQGTVLGKALAGLEAETGVIQMLVMLQ